MDSLETLSRNVENFIADVVRIDDDAAEAINQSKEEFYDKYNYLKPDCEKNIWEKICDGFASVGEWCKEHWKLVVTAVLVIVAVVIIVLSGGTAVAPFLLMIAKGTIAGAVSGGLIGGLSSLLNGGSFMDGFEEGAFSGAIGGAIFGGIGGAGQALGKGISCLSKLGEFVKDLSIISGAASTGMAAFDLLAMADLLIGGDNNWLYDLNQRLHSSTLYNSFQIGVSVLAAFTGGMRQTMTCFVAGTMILTASGLIAIENIKAGDKVISTNPETFETAEKSVLETYVRQTDKLIHLVINGEEIITTETHPFYVKDRGFVDAGKLLVGDSLLDVYGNILVVEDTRTEHLDEPETVYNFQVEDFHTYYVGERFIWVHNGECGGSYRSLKRDKNGKMYDSEEIHHMPAKKSSLLSEGDGPAIRMEKRDHERTASWGRAKKSQVYRLKQENLIKAGKFREAIQMDVDDLKVQFGNKYDKGIREMWEYVNELERDGKI